MGWQDRNYGNNNRLGDARFKNPFLNLLFGSLPLGTWFNIRVRIHSTLIIWFLISFLMANSKYGLGLERTLISNLVIFTIILLHEFGHCIGAHFVGGYADEILLWPLGGLAYAHPPHRPFPSLITYAAGPAVNVLISLITGIALISLGHFSLDWLNPLIAFGGGTLFVSHETYLLIDSKHLVGWLFWFFTASTGNLFFNLLPIFPLDGGGMFRAILWKPLGYYRATNIACIIGMIGAGAGFVFGLVFNGGAMLLFLAIAGFITCYQVRLANKMQGAEPAEQYDLSAAWEHPDRPAARKKSKKRWFNAARKRALAEQAQQAQIDAILDKVKQKGLHSLFWFEKRALKKATERQRQSDLAERM